MRPRRLYSEKELDAARSKNTRLANRVILFVPPVLPAAFGSLFWRSMNYSPKLESGMLRDAEGIVGDVLYPYVFILAYTLASFAFIATVWPRGYWQVLALFWISWLWFYFCVATMDDPLFAIASPLALAALILVIVVIPRWMWSVIATRKI